jgi:TRAP-type C4-dicarboxylate transport system permease small subunit
MDGEAEPPEDEAAKIIAVSTVIWLTLCTGVLILTGGMVWVRASTDAAPALDPPELGYAFLAVAAGPLVLALVGLPSTARRPDTGDAAGGLPHRYQADFILRAALAEGAGVVAAVGFFVSGLWPVLAGSVVALAVLIALRPTRAGYEAWADRASRPSDSETGSG